MHIHILGICGTFMGSIALLARELGYRVTGSDQNVYPPMSTQLEQSGIELIQGYDPVQLEPAPDLVLIGNALSRGNPCVEAVLNRGLKYSSGPQWLHDEILVSRWVLAVAGTHGKTTTASMLTWILEYAQMSPGYLIGGIPLNFEYSARLGTTDFFVIEADEYDTAFFDKRSKFVHYAPRTLVINSVEYDHADIFDDLAAIERQFHHLIRIVPGQGQVIAVAPNESIDRILDQGCWSPVVRSNQLQDPGPCGEAPKEQPGASVADSGSGGSSFELVSECGERTEVNWSLQGAHNQINALNAALAARHVGVPWSVSGEALSAFKNVKRRMELLGEFAGIRLYDDFAHHPTAIATTLEGMRAQKPESNIVAVIEPRSNTMKQGCFKSRLASSARVADRVYWYQPREQQWNLSAELEGYPDQSVFNDLDALYQTLLQQLPERSELVLMSNGGFGGLHERLKAGLSEREV